MKNSKIFLSLFIMVLVCDCIYSQTIKDSISIQKKEKAFSSDYNFYAKSEYIYQHYNYLSIGIGYLNPGILDGGPCNSFILGTHGFSLNSDIKLSSNQFNLVPKLSYEYSLMFIAAKANLGCITDFKQTHYLASPEIGLTFFGFCYFFYGYNFTDKNTFNISGSKVIFGINWTGWL